VPDQLALVLPGHVDERTAVLSACGRYRYLLGRRWADGPPLGWVLLNPSTADATVDDPTIRRLVAFTRAAGYGAALVGNLVALRATDPAELARHPNPTGPYNDTALDELVTLTGGAVVAGWSAAADPHRVAAVLAGPLADVRLRCLGVTASGQPRHPLYVPGTRPLTAYQRMTSGGRW
jgi:hypothetical protein